MDNLKYYNDSFAYDYEIFAPKSAESKATILEYPEDKRKVKNKASAKGILSLVKKLILSALVLSAVCGSLYLRAEISSLNWDARCPCQTLRKQPKHSVCKSAKKARLHT